MEEAMRHSPFFADIDWSNLPPAPNNVPPRPIAPMPVRRNPPRRTNATWNLFAPVVEENQPSAKKETD